MTRPIRVLLVEDNPGDADLIRDTLDSGARKLDMAVVRDGAAASDYLLRRGAYADAERPDLVLLDLNLPGVDGRRVLAEMRLHNELRAIPVVVLTSSDAESDIAGSYEAGASCYVTKPGELAAFQSAVKSIEAFWFKVAKLP
ncbi:MAG TPA: response regulator [Kofleriaceae bacterium]